MTEEAEKLAEHEETTPRIYEVGFLLVPTLAEANVPRETMLLKDELLKAGAQVMSEEMPRLRTLAYPMRPKRGGKPGEHFTSAYFGWVKFELASERIKSVEEALQGLAKVLRFIVVKTVRESTLSVSRAPRQEFRRDGAATAPKDAPPSVVVSEAELDKSLEKLIAE